MKITADTNLLVRVITRDDPVQAAIAERELRGANLVAITTPALCELTWVLTRGYGLRPAQVAIAIRTLINSQNITADRQVVEAGLATLENGSEFADGAIALEGANLGSDVFVSFDKRAVKLLNQQGQAARVPS